MTRLLLAGDVGGTKTDLGLYSAAAGPLAPIVSARFQSRDYASLAEIVREFLTKVGMPADRACIAVAGPVVEGQAHVTNLAWVVDERELATKLGIGSVHLMNDVEAIAHAIPSLPPTDLTTLSRGDPVPGGTIAVIAPGTGLGEAFVTWDGARHHAHPSEGGHANFSPATPLQIELLGALATRLGHVSVEHVCSGRSGLPNLYTFLRDSGRAAESPAMAQTLASAADQGRPITEGALRSPEADPLCLATIELFLSILATEAGNLALRVLATGGVYVAGGIAPRVVPLMDAARFREGFAGEGRLKDLLRRVPVHVVMARAALPGAAAHGLELMTTPMAGEVPRATPDS